jgi:hypothetical protein
MFSPQDMEQRAAARHAELMHEAATERLSRQASGPRRSLRPRLAAVLYALADRLDKSCTTVQPPLSAHH